MFKRASFSKKRFVSKYLTDLHKQARQVEVAPTKVARPERPVPGAVTMVEVGGGVQAGVLPWPYYGEAGTPVWQVFVVGPGEDEKPIHVHWSVRLGRWAKSRESLRLCEELTPDQRADLEVFMLDTLEGCLA